MKTVRVGEAKSGTCRRSVVVVPTAEPYTRGRPSPSCTTIGPVRPPPAPTSPRAAQRGMRTAHCCSRCCSPPGLGRCAWHANRDLSRVQRRSTLSFRDIKIPTLREDIKIPHTKGRHQNSPQ